MDNFLIHKIILAFVNRSQHFAAEAWSRLCEHPLGDKVESSVAGWAGDVTIGHVHEQRWPAADHSLAELTQTQTLNVVVQVCAYQSTCMCFD